MDTNIVNTQAALFRRESEARKMALAESLQEFPELIDPLTGGPKFIESATTGKVGYFHSLLIDTIKVEVVAEHKSLSEVGEEALKHVKGNIYRVRSKFKTTATIHSDVDRGRLVIEVSPPMYLTGQNIIGLKSMRTLAAEAVIQVLKDARIRIKPEARERIMQGDMVLRRADCAVHCDCGTPFAARALLLAVRDFMIGASGWFTVIGYGESVYHAMESKAASLKAYLKGVQLRAAERKNKPALSPNVVNPERLSEACQSAVRFELVLRNPGLKSRGLVKVSDWKDDSAAQVLRESISKLLSLPAVIPNLPDMNGLGSKTAQRLKLHLLGDIGAFDDAQATKGKLRKEIIKKTGIDIRNPMSVERQREAVIVAGELLKRGLKYRDHAEKWERLKAGAFKKGSKPRAGWR